MHLCSSLHVMTSSELFPEKVTPTTTTTDISLWAAGLHAAAKKLHFNYFLYRVFGKHKDKIFAELKIFRDLLESIRTKLLIMGPLSIFSSIDHFLCRRREEKNRSINRARGNFASSYKATCVSFFFIFWAAFFSGGRPNPTQTQGNKTDGHKTAKSAVRNDKRDLMSGRPIFRACPKYQVENGRTGVKRETP